ncbi:MAG: 2-oxoacid:acceptor oxidoreductase family protein [Treponema sp.]|jgi:2-oxoglutarate ferredoxin oxidoreductase subunit gamma|nr:2-oxoacid:acceptor oxidoreductase family protein [Treponema sp.]
MTEKSFFAGFGGQGIISMGQIWVYCAMKEGKNVTFFPFYGAEKRGGIARASVIISDEEIASPLVTTPDSVLVMNGDSLPLCEKALKPGGLMLINSSLVKERPARGDITVVTVEATGIAENLAGSGGASGGGKAANMVALGAMAKRTSALRLTDIEVVLRNFFPPDKHKFVAMNVEAIQAGFNAV